eukprot:TRINITY_DN22489_c0_g1_i1.p1 TRINITY_DN22489_c0_g1~~TRINITY_DN22489_c0_g1_i1.p1  ORF type:complete len:411 (-),score=101.89 TRINITY_DN22489_c0_g1_i1:26-1258(-)
MWDSIPLGPDDPILGMNTAYNKDTSKDKINLGVGAYRTEEGVPYVMNVVKKAEERLLHSKTVNKEYLSIGGLEEFNKHSAALIFGADRPALKEGRIATVQAISGTGALRVGAAFLATFRPADTAVYISDPTWSNHYKIFEHAGLKNQKKYRYFDSKTNGLDFKGMTEDISAAPAGSIILLHTCAHNPTGVDPSIDQWKQIIQIIKDKKLIAFFDTAYQGFATGDLVQDSMAVRLATDAGVELLASQSYSKNFGLYSERVGALNVLCSSSAVVTPVLSQLNLIIRPMYSNPPAHGARIVATILSDQELYNEWLEELKVMSGRIMTMRKQLHAALKQKGTPGNWDHILNQIGMFSYTGLNQEQCEKMIGTHKVYMLKNGRISMVGLTSKTVDKLASAIDDVVRNVPTKQSKV